MSEHLRDLGKHEAEIANLKIDIKDVQDEIGKVKQDVHKILMIISEAKGGYKALMFVASISSAVGAITVKFLAWLMEK